MSTLDEMTLAEAPACGRGARVSRVRPQWCEACREPHLWCDACGSLSCRHVLDVVTRTGPVGGPERGPFRGRTSQASQTVVTSLTHR